MRIGVLASGGGTNLQSIIDACSAGGISGEVALVVSNNSQAGALERARRSGIPALHVSSFTHPEPQLLDRIMLDALTEAGVDLVALAGYMKKLGPSILEAYANKVLNIHPALLPRFGGQGMYGMAVHRAVIAAGVPVTGPTVHLVNVQYDDGPILAQIEVPVVKDDTPHSLQKRVLKAEHRIYPETIEAYNRGTIAVYEGAVDTVIRPLCVSEEYTEAARIIRMAFRDAADRFSVTENKYPSHPSFADSAQLRGILENGGVFFGAFRNGAMFGCAGIEPFKHENDIWSLEKLAVLPDNRFSGLGSLLLDHARKAVGKYGGNRITAGIIDADTDLKNWYKRRGFTAAEIREVPGMPLNVRIMEKKI